jgi:hypothetical protein
MTWKSTAAASGLMVIATWLASHAPVGGPREQPLVAPSAAHTEAAAAEIQREAARLHDRLQQVAAYKLPTRNPFRFGSPPARSARPEATISVEQAAPAAVEPQVPTLRIMLSGIGEDAAGDQVTRTAIISTPDDVHIVKVGETIAGVYTVTDIAADSVELARVDDGSTVRLSLKR